MGANCAGIVGGELFRSDDKPYYHRGWNIIAAFMSLALALAISLVITYALLNKRMKKAQIEELSNDPEKSIDSRQSQGGSVARKTWLYNF